MTFAVLGVLGLIYNARNQHDLFFLGILIVYYTALTIMFA